MDFSLLTVVKLKQELKSRNLPISGNKVVLISRLNEYESKNKIPDQSSGKVRMFDSITSTLVRIKDNVNADVIDVDNLYILYRAYIVLASKHRMKIKEMLNQFEFYLVFAWKLKNIRIDTLGVLGILESTITDKYYDLTGTEARIPPIDSNTMKKILYSAYGILSEECELMDKYHN